MASHPARDGAIAAQRSPALWLFAYPTLLSLSQDLSMIGARRPAELVIPRERRRGIQFAVASRSKMKASGILGHPPEPVIRPAEGQTGWRVTTADQEGALRTCPQRHSGMVRQHQTRKSRGSPMRNCAS